MNMFRMSMGTGKITVLCRSEEISVSVWR